MMTQPQGQGPDAKRVQGEKKDSPIGPTATPSSGLVPAKDSGAEIIDGMEKGKP